MKKLDGLIWALLFLVFGFLQYNDPDGLIWMLIYGLAAMVSLLSFKNMIPRIALIVLLVGFVIGAIYLWPAQYQGLSLKEGYTSSIEEARESLGLGICAIGMLWIFIRSNKG